MPDQPPNSCAREGAVLPADFDPWYEGGWEHARNRKGGRHLSDGRPIGDGPMEDSDAPDDRT